MPSRARRQKVSTFYPRGAHLLGLRCALLTFELVNVVFRLGRCHTTFNVAVEGLVPEFFGFERRAFILSGKVV